MLDKGLNNAHVDGDHCCVTVPYVIPYCGSLEKVGEHFENVLELIKLRKRHGNIMKTFWELGEKTLRIPK
jgi:hypothetical protein